MTRFPKKLGALSLLLAVLVGVTPANAATYSPITFTPGGERLVWSDNPEEIKTTTFNGKQGVFTVQTNMDASHPYVFEYYEYNNAGTPLTFAVQLTNTSNASVQYRVTKNAKGYASADYRTMSANMHVNYENSTTDIYRTLAPNQSVLVPESTLTVGNNNTVNGRVRITATGSGLNGRIVVSKSSTSSQAQITPQATDDGKSRTSAVFMQSTLYGWLDLGTKGTTHKICGSEWTLNSGEYPQSAYASNAGKNGNGKGIFQYLCHGNYSQYYAFSLRNSSGNRLLMKAEDGQPRLVMVKRGNNAWEKLNISATGTTVTMSGSEFKFMLTGSNSGSITMQVVA